MAQKGLLNILLGSIPPQNSKSTLYQQMLNESIYGNAYLRAPNMIHDIEITSLFWEYPFSYSEIERAYKYTKKDKAKTELLIKTALWLGRSLDDIIDHSKTAAKEFKAPPTKKVKAPDGYEFKNGKKKIKVYRID